MILKLNLPKDYSQGTAVLYLKIYVCWDKELLYFFLPSWHFLDEPKSPASVTSAQVSRLPLGIHLYTQIVKWYLSEKQTQTTTIHSIQILSL